MEDPLESHLEETLNNPGVVGVLCTDKQGLCLTAKGTASPDSAGLVSAIAQQASQLLPDNNSAPVICIESDKGNVMIKTHEDITMAIHKMPTY
ncbi:ragulator complex protein LAMTOR5-like [Amphiura filiformis]|uniref:ragulator complex protein LAMTOR5-like n=1 Tax=Amphiura filiformis TaxID=82378 RepID=UPI003B21C1A2